MHPRHEPCEEPGLRTLPDDWRHWRSASPLGGSRPTKADLAEAAARGEEREDVLPYPADERCAGLLRLLVVGINPGLWTAAVNAPFARPGNRFWTSLAAAGLTDGIVDASGGLPREAERHLAERGIGMTNLVSRPSARADELTASELRGGGERLVDRVGTLLPRAVAILGVTAFRTGFGRPKAKTGRQPVEGIVGWPDGVQLWVLPNPSGLNAHETVQSLAQKWTEVWEASVEA